MDRFSISVIIPTLNAGSVLSSCLQSIKNQIYPQNKIEIIVADGGSSDNTKVIAKKYDAKIVPNLLKTGESGKAAALKHAKGKIIALIDSDNVLPDKNWFNIMTQPFTDEEIIASEPISYTYRRQDPFLTRYFALLGMNDPLCLFIGNYDRYSYVTGKWTDLAFPQEDKGNYLKVKLNHEPIPTIGANGTLIRKKVLLDAVGKANYLFDIDILIKLLRQKGKINVAKVKTGIVHTFVEDDPMKFFRKQLRRINDMSFHHAKKNRDLDWEATFFWKVIWFQIQCFLVFPILFQMIRGYLRKPDPAWLFHPTACYSTWLIYLYGWIKGKVNPAESDRRHWQQ